jgi:hypothetical protein
MHHCLEDCGAWLCRIEVSADTVKHAVAKQFGQSEIRRFGIIEMTYETCQSNTIPGGGVKQFLPKEVLNRKTKMM